MKNLQEAISARNAALRSKLNAANHLRVVRNAVENETASEGDLEVAREIYETADKEVARCFQDMGQMAAMQILGLTTQ